MSSDYIENIEVKAANEIIWTGRLRSKLAKNIWFNSKRDGSIQMTSVVQGKVINSGGLGYVTPNYGDRKLLIYHGNNEFDLKALPENP